MFVYGHFHSVLFAFQHFLNLSFPHIPRRSVAVCVVKALAAEWIQRSPSSEQGSKCGQILIAIGNLVRFCDAVIKEYHK